MVPYDRAYDNALTFFSKLAKEAEALKVSVGIENVWNKFLLSPLEMRGFIDAVGSDYVGSYFDVGNVVYSGYPEHWISILNKRIKKVHFMITAVKRAGRMALWICWRAMLIIQ